MLNPLRGAARQRWLGLLVLAAALLPAAVQATIEPLEPADSVLVVKSAHRLYLLREGRAFRSYRIALGLNPKGPKEREGDRRTPEGSYQLDARNAGSDYFLSLHVSYPSPQDLAEARRHGWKPGGSIMIHGQPNTPHKSATYYGSADWTDGCIALSNDDMLEVWLLTRANTPIEIRP
jgi:murein L,D-transpeptidase YafK